MPSLLFLTDRALFCFAGFPFCFCFFWGDVLFLLVFCLCFCIPQSIFYSLFWKITCYLVWDWKSEICFDRSNESLSWVFSISLPNVVKNSEAINSNKRIFFPVSIFFSLLRVSELWKNFNKESIDGGFFPQTITISKYRITKISDVFCVLINDLSVWKEKKIPWAKEVVYCYSEEAYACMC